MASFLKSKKYYAVLLLLLMLVIALPFMRNRKKFYVNSGVVWTTEYHITYEALDNLNDSIQHLLTVIDNSVSPYNKKSLVTAINENKRNEVDDFFVKLYNMSTHVNKSSGGLYDPTVMPLVNAWGFGYKSGKLPTQAQLDSILAFVGLEKTSLTGKVLKKNDPRTQFDFSSIAKGMACDEIAQMLVRNGAVNYMVEIGGEVVARGVNERGGVWRVSVDMPVPNDSTGSPVHANAMVLNLDRQAIATSGSYRKFKEVDGKKVSHIVNPKTGGSETSHLLSVSIVAPNCMMADAWATACMAMGLEATMSKFEKDNNIGVMTISTDDDGNFVIWSNKPFANLVE